jgi:predicted nucleotidyltransferase
MTEIRCQLPAAAERVYEALLDQAKTGVLAVGVGGSYAAQRAVPGSDVDYYVLVKAQSQTQLLQVALAVTTQLPPPAILRRPTAVPNFGHTATLVYSDDVIVQLNFLANDDFPMNPMRSRTLVLWDESGAFGRLIEAARNLPLDVTEHLAEQYAYGVIRYKFAKNYLERGQFVRATTYLDDMVRVACCLLRAQQGCFDLSLHMSHPEKRIEEELGTAAAEIVQLATNSTGAPLVARIERCMEFIGARAGVLQLAAPRLKPLRVI